MSSSAASTIANPTTASSADLGGWIVHKFGGTSLATSECYANSAEIVRSLPLSEANGAPLRKCIVVSAMGEVKTAAGSLVAKLISQRSPGKVAQPLDKVTNYLIKCTVLAAQNDSTYLDLLASLKQRHTQVVEELLGGGESDLKRTLLESLEKDFQDLSYILRAVWLSKTYDLEHNWWFGFGEIWSARLMHAFLNKLDSEAAKSGDAKYAKQNALFVDAREIVFLTKHKDPMPDYQLSRSKLEAWLQASPAAQAARIIVVTGYIATTATGTPTTLGRDGSDYSASIFAALLRARSVTIWTDVDGVYSANPAQVKSAVILPEMSYDEASELAYFGAKVIHPKTMLPCVRENVPVWIRNTFNSSHPGSCIVSAVVIAEHEKASKSLIKKSPSMDTVVGYGVRGFSEISNLNLLIVEGTGMMGVPGVCARLFGALRNANVNVVLVTQAGSEHSICVCLPAIHGQLGLETIRREFRDELENGEIETVALRTGVACLAIVGDWMRERRGAAARMFAALADAGINIMAIAQGSSERNISVIISQSEVATGLKAVHQAFLASEYDKEYSPLLSASPAPPLPKVPSSLGTSSTSILTPLPPSASSVTPTLSPFADTSILDKLFPLPIVSTLAGLQSRPGCSITKVSLVIPTFLSVGLWDYAFGKQLPDWERMKGSQNVLAQVLVAVAHLLSHASVQLDQVTVPHNLAGVQSQQQLVNALVFASVAMDKKHRIVATATFPADSQAPTLSVDSQYDPDCAPHGNLAVEQASLCIWTTASPAPIQITATRPPTF